MVFSIEYENLSSAFHLILVILYTEQDLYFNF